MSGVPLSELILPALLLVLIPFNQCSIQLFLRNMRNLSELSISAWMTVGMLLVFLPVSFLQRPENESSLFYFLHGYNYVDWLIAFSFGFCGIYSQTMRAKAVHYEEPARLTVLNYFQSVIQLFMDVLFLNTPFNSQQIFGVVIVFGANSIKWVSSIQKHYF